MKHVILSIAVLLSSAKALAFSTCMGETYTGILVEVSINTVGSMGVPQEGQVKITSKEGEVRTYSLQRSEIVQYFETDENSRRAIVGLAAYQEANNPVWIKYVGQNYQEDLTKVLRDPNRKKQSGNEMRVWKGPGYGPEQQHQFLDVVCSVVIDA